LNLQPVRKLEVFEDYGVEEVDDGDLELVRV